MPIPLNPERLQTQLIWANEHQVEPEYLHQIYDQEEESRAWWLLEGGLELRTETKTISVTPGRWVFLGHSPTEVIFQPGSRICSINFLLLLTDGRPLFTGLAPLLVPEAFSRDLNQTAKQILKHLIPWKNQETLLLGRHRIHLPDNLAIEAAFYGYLRHYCDVLIRSGKTPLSSEEIDPRVQDALQQLSRWDMQEPFSEETLASAVGLGPVQLRRLFEKVTGHSPFQHYDQRRMHLATHSLKESQLPMKELAFDLGFSSPAHFSNWFRSRRGIPPGAYRKRTNNE